MVKKAKAYLPEVLARLTEYEAPAYQRFCVVCGDSFVAAAFDEHLCSAKECVALYWEQARDSLEHQIDLVWEDALAVVQGPQRRSRRVYFLRSKATGLIKIGSSTSVASRIRALQTASGEALELIVDIPADDGHEGLFHRQFAHCREQGEWFRPIPELLELLDDLQAEREGE